MIDRIEAQVFARRLSNGKTCPAILIADAEADAPREIVVKLSEGCERKVTSLAMEMVAVLLAGDLELPVPRPWFVLISPELITSIPDNTWGAMAVRSSPLAFGSQLLPSGFSLWTPSVVPVGRMVEHAAGVLLFDVAMDNVDRRAGNPNCLVRKEDIRIFDHELAFPPLILGARPPWEVGSLNYLQTPGAHIFRDALRKRSVDWTAVLARWRGLSNAKLDDYEAVLPAEWSVAAGAVRGAIEKIKRVRDNVDACVAEIARLLI